MVELTQEEEQQKKAIYETMSARGKARIDRIGYDKWNPFLKPKDPIDIRRIHGKWTTQGLVRLFLQETRQEKYSNSFARGALEFCLGIINNDQKYIGMYEFCIWYHDLLAKEGLSVHNTDD